MNTSLPPDPRTRERPPLALIAGPTASGKSALAIALAERIDGVVINADSMQVYRDLRVVTARPSDADEAMVPHRLFGHVDGAEACSAARWASEARAAIDACHAAGRVPIVVGGTGLYFRTLLDGIAPVPPIDEVVRAEVRALDAAAAHAALKTEDPALAARIAPADAQRTARALEVIRATGRSLGDWQAARSGGIADRVRLAPLVLLPPRAWLNKRCDDRFETILRDGRDEVRALLARRLDPALPVMRAIGVPQIGAMLRFEHDKAAARTLGCAATRQYAKRQYTWLATQTPIDWPRFETVIQQAADVRDATLLLKAALTQ